MTDIRISWSSLRNHMECRQRSFLQRTGHKAKMENLRVFFPGTVTDRVVRDWLLQEPEKNPGLMPEMVEAIVLREETEIREKGKQLRWKDSKDRDSIIEECQKAVRLIEPDLNKFVLPYEYDVDFSFKAPIKARHPQTGELETILLQGFMDIIVKRPEDRWCVYDVKHTKDEYYWKKTRGQLSFYDLVVEILFGVGTVEVGLLQPLCKETAKLFELDEAERTILLKHVLDMADDIWSQNHEPTPDTGPCSFCNVKHACTKFTPVKSADGKRRVSLLIPKTGE